MAESFTVEAILSAVDKDFTKTMGKANDSLDGLDDKNKKASSSMWDIAKGAGVFKLIDAGIRTVTGSIGGANSRIDTLNNSNRTFENMGISTTDSKKAMDALQKSIQGLPTPLDSAVSGMTALTATYDDIDLGQKVFSSLNNAILGFGGTAAQVDNAIMQLSQLPMDGPLDAQTWNSLRNSGLTPVLTAMAKESGMSVSAMKTAFGEGELKVEDFTNKLIQMNKDGGGGLKSLEKIAKDSTGGIQTGIANAKTAVTRGVAKVIDAVNEALKGANLGNIGSLVGSVGEAMEKALTKVAEYLPKAIQFIGDLYSKIEPFLPLIGAVVGYIATYQTIMGTAKKAVQLYTGAQKILNAVMNASKFGLIVTAIVLVAGAFIYLWKTNEDFRNFFIKTWETIKETFSKAVEWIKNTWASLKSFGSDVWNGIKEGAQKAVDSVKDAWNDTKKWFSDLWSGIKETSSNAWDGTKDGAGKAIGGIKDVWSDFKNWIKDIASVVDGVVQSITAPFEPLFSFFKDLWEGIKTIAGEQWNIIKGVVSAPLLLLIDLITGEFDRMEEDLLMVWTSIKTSFETIFNTLKDLAGGYFKAIVETANNLWVIMRDFAISIWTSIKESAISIWTGIKTWFLNTVNSMVEGVKNAWNSLKEGTINTFKAIVEWIKTTWANLRTWFKNTIDAIVEDVKTGWNNLKESTLNVFNGIVDGANRAWEWLVTGVSDMIDTVQYWFDKISEIDLWEAGKAIMNSFFDGLTNVWSEVQDFVGGIGEWIREHKGPISYDKKLLIDNGQAVMFGLNRGLTSGFMDVMKNVNGMAGTIQDGIGNSFNAVNNRMNSSLSHSIEANAELKVNQGSQPAHINLNIGGRTFKAFASDISDANGSYTDLYLQTT